MSYTIEYKGPMRAYDAANDVGCYISPTQRESLLALNHTWGKEGIPAHRRYANLRMALMVFVGVRGFPARVFAFNVVYGHLPRLKAC